MKLQLTLEHMKRGLDEDGKRIQMFTSAVVNEQAVKAGAGSFTYTGGTVASDKHDRCAPPAPLQAVHHQLSRTEHSQRRRPHRGAS